MYTLVEICPECRSEDITVIDREFDRTSQCFRYRYHCFCCRHTWWEEGEHDVEEESVYWGRYDL